MKRSRVGGRVGQVLSALVAVLMLAIAPITPAAADHDSPITADSSVPDDDVGVRVVGGNDAEPGTYPFMTVLEYIVGESTIFQCGATLVDPLWVLTAAHCVDEVGPEELAFLVGAHDRTSDDGERRYAAMTVLHPDYTEIGLGNDLALVQLTEPSTRPLVTLGDATNAANWQSASEATAVGWGDTRNFPRFPGTLQEVDLPLVSDSDCAATQVGDRLSPEIMTCAGTTGRDTCTGDSGGPLLVTSGADFVQIGISSFGSRNCAEPNFPGVYTEVPHFADWIKTVIAPPIGQPVEVSHVVSCLAGNARVDTNTVNVTGEPATYRMEFGALSPRQWTSAPGDWWRSPVTGRPDGSHRIVMRRNGEVINQTIVRTECDTESPVGSPYEVAVINGCRAGNGYLLFQFVNPTAASRGYVIEFESVPNRSTSASGHGASVRAVTGRGDGVWNATVKVANAPIATFQITVDCDP